MDAVVVGKVFGCAKNGLDLSLFKISLLCYWI
jgi:hypothetical protein